MEPLTVVDQAPQTGINFFRWIQIVVIIIVIAWNAYYLSVVSARYVPIALRCDPEFTTKQENVTEFTIIDGAQLEQLEYSKRTFWPELKVSFNECLCHIKTCVVKCCSFNESFLSAENLTCSSENSSSVSSMILNTTVYYKLQKNRLDDLHIKITNYSDFVVYSNTKCSVDKSGGESFTVYKLSEEAFLIEDGTVLSDDLYYIDVNDYCIESLNGQSRIFYMGCVSNYNGIQSIAREIRHFLAPNVCMYVSQACLFITLLVYLTLKELRNFHGKLLISYLMSLVLLNAVLFMNIVLNYQVSPHVMHFCVLTIPSWVTILCVDMWLVFGRSLRFRYSSRSSSRTHWTRFLIFSAIGWGIPLIFCGLTAIVGVTPGYDDSCPQFTLKADPCFFNSFRTLILLLSFPAMFMLEMNFLLFLSLLFHMRTQIKESEAISTESSRRHAKYARHSLYLYLKLAIVTGVDWLFIHICLSGIFNTETSELLALIMFYCQGVIIFVVLICNRHVLRLLQKHYCQ
uniref:G-protein coupled receptors family 2 profile 2 domain-containing protein n=1 Tax=Graphocephala atropunctata TaxID=36148 RepID=A0A1B6KS49_9HEMI